MNRGREEEVGDKMGGKESGLEKTLNRFGFGLGLIGCQCTDSSLYRHSRYATNPRS